MLDTRALPATAPNLAISHLETAETLITQLKAIVLLSSAETAIGILARHSLSLLSGLHNDLAVVVETNY